MLRSLWITYQNIRNVYNQGYVYGFDDWATFFSTLAAPSQNPQSARSPYLIAVDSTTGMTRLS
ncbi:MAG: hypothetical protein KME32_34230 [Mojavia pulchra JT2-VF2]|uniref:Uncharacterized protein n=1 Tax=Mojavia pulchra JT2-VF2 TaxID=287848 RepID=A0A951Q4S7_9NOST|nr:hypothetical protein [Mojavia pulchra JT2-VF2]